MKRLKNCLDLMFENILFTLLFKQRLKLKGIGRRILVKRNAQRLLRLEGARIGHNCRLQSFFFPEPYLVSLGNHVHIGTDVQLITHDGSVWVIRNTLEDPSLDIFGPISIGNNVAIGNRVLILPNVTIGDNVVIGAGAIVSKNIPSNCVAVGSPARPIGTIDDFIERRYPQTIKTKLLNSDEKKIAVKKWLDESTHPKIQM